VALGWLWACTSRSSRRSGPLPTCWVAAGYSAWLLAAFYYVIEVRRWERWATPFVWIGMNSIAVYVGGSLINYARRRRRLAGGSVRNILDTP